MGRTWENLKLSYMTTKIRWNFGKRFFFFLISFQCGKRFCLCERSIFKKNIHRLDTRGASNMASYGRIEEFLPAQCGWITYAEGFSYYFEANSITDAKRKKAVLLSVCGTETFSLLKDLITPDSLRDKTFDELSQAFEEHLRNTATQRHPLLSNYSTFMYADNNQTKPSQTLSPT